MIRLDLPPIPKLKGKSIELHPMNFMIFVRHVRQRVLFAFLLCITSTAAAQYTNGIYAEFNTSMGSYTCRLDHVVAPKTVANFIGLATGERAWLDAPSGMVKTNPFFNGTTFHRVIAGFMNQGGSRNGMGTDGPGYQFVDEFNAGARHDGFGVLSSANSGPDSNGSQFFITVSTRTNLNDVYSIFGRLCGGSNVVYSINNVTTGPGDKPLSNVVLQSVMIRRVGSDAQAFDIHAQGLPVVTNLTLGIAKSGPNVDVTFSNRLDVENRFFGSIDLRNWFGVSFGFETSLPLMATVQTPYALEREFFRMIQVQYPPSLHVPKDVLNRVVTLNISGGSTFIITFNSVGGGSYTNSTLGGSGPISIYSWKQDAYRGRLNPFWMGGYPIMALHLDYDTPNAGTFKGTQYFVYPSSPAPGALTGTFTSVP
jgi:cyclophilin family peptidyl-prolyl cis-trans isomerase